ncbi:hypothetical protein D3C78_1037820 [compost metagenome]
MSARFRNYRTIRSPKLRRHVQSSRRFDLRYQRNLTEILRMNLPVKYVPNMLLVARKHIHVPKYAVKAPHILILNVGPVAPFQYHERHAVRAWAQIRADLELCWHPAALTVPYEFAVDPQVEA